jgi:hypothetical protein
MLPGYHIYAMDRKVSPFIPTALKLTLPAGLAPAGDWVGPTPERDQGGVEIYTDAAVFRRAVKALAGTAPKRYSIGAELHYQVCNDTMCYPPKKVALDSAVDITGVGQP